MSAQSWVGFSNTIKKKEKKPCQQEPELQRLPTPAFLLGLFVLLPQAN